MNFKYKLPKGYSIKELPNDEFGKLWQKPGKEIFPDQFFFYANEDIYSPKELSKFKKLREQFDTKNHYRLNLGLFHNKKFVGWAWGFQETPTVFYMCNSAILEKHRRKNLYTCLMNETLKRVVEKGFMKVYSRHILTNNSIIIAKLKNGFKITNFELSEAFGAMVHLTYFPHKIKEEILDFRAGHRWTDKQMKKVFKVRSK